VLRLSSTLIVTFLPFGLALLQGDGLIAEHGFLRVQASIIMLIMQSIVVYINAQSTHRFWQLGHKRTAQIWGIGTFGFALMDFRRITGLMRLFRITVFGDNEALVFLDTLAFPVLISLSVLIKELYLYKIFLPEFVTQWKNSS